MSAYTLLLFAANPLICSYVAKRQIHQLQESCRGSKCHCLLAKTYKAAVTISHGVETAENLFLVNNVTKQNLSIGSKFGNNTLL